MSLHVIYSNATGTTLDLSTRVAMAEVATSDNAEEGSVASFPIVVDDQSGDLEMVGWRRVYIYDDEAPALNQVIFNGYTYGEDVTRGPWITGTSRQWETTLVDSDTVLSWRAVNGTDANRPAETDVARVQWLLTTTELNTVDDSRYVSIVGPVTMSPSDYRGQRVLDILDDCAQQSGKNYYVWYAEDVGQLSLWYGKSGLEVYDSTIRLSNDDTLDDAVTTFMTYPDVRLAKTPERVYSGALVQYANGRSVYVQNTTTGNTFTFRDAIVPAELVTTDAAALARGQRYLLDMRTEQVIITARYITAAASVNKLLKGQRVRGKWIHLPDLNSFTWLRVLNRQVKHIAPRFYEVAVDLVLDTVPPPVNASGFIRYMKSGDCTGQPIQIIWEFDNDSSSGCQGTDVGPIFAGPVITNVINPTYGGFTATGHDGWIINAQGEIDCRLFGDIGGVAGTNVHTIRLYMNGVQVYSFEVLDSVGRFFDKSFTLDCPLATGNHLTAWIEHIQPGGFSGIPAGTGGCGQYLQIVSARLSLP